MTEPSRSERTAMICPKCKGTGEDWTDVPTDSGALNGEDCPACGGTGEVQTDKDSPRA